MPSVYLPTSECKITCIPCVSPKYLSVINLITPQQLIFISFFSVTRLFELPALPPSVSNGWLSSLCVSHYVEKCNFQAGKLFFALLFPKLQREGAREKGRFILKRKFI